MYDKYHMCDLYFQLHKLLFLLQILFVKMLSDFLLSLFKDISRLVKYIIGYKINYTVI